MKFYSIEKKIIYKLSPCADPPGVLGPDAGGRTEVDEYSSAEWSEYEAKGRAEDPYSDRNGKVNGGLPAGDVVVDVGDAKCIDCCLAHTNAQKSCEQVLEE